jgi:hypothetical protein
VESIRDVTLTDGGDGTVAVGVALAAGLEADGSWLLFGIDAGTAGAVTFDHVLLLTHEGAVFARWDGTDYGPFDHRPVAPTLAGDRVTFTLTLDDIGARSFGFCVASNSGGDVDCTRRTYPPPR